MSTQTHPKIILIGLAGSPEVPEHLKGKHGSPEEIAAKIRADIARAENAGFRCTSFQIEPTEPEARLEELEVLLKTGNFDAVMFGAGVRLFPAYSILFETLVNLCRRHVPHVPFLFNNGPDTIYSGLRRAFPESNQ
ncbi:hypothetical protein F5X99DRAFT_377100 [Biscogniauxia marginata]|nr:hypothetical protein F5X99DRAFT_377100 [Biscogniauxia marginata]